MGSEESIGIIELGDTNLKCLIFKINNNNDSEILSATSTSSEGIYNDVVMNLKKASSSIIPIESCEFITLLLSYHLSLNQ